MLEAFAPFRRVHGLVSIGGAGRFHARLGDSWEAPNRARGLPSPKMGPVENRVALRQCDQAEFKRVEFELPGQGRNTVKVRRAVPGLNQADHFGGGPADSRSDGLLRVAQLDTPGANDCADSRARGFVLHKLSSW